MLAYLSLLPPPSASGVYLLEGEISPLRKRCPQYDPILRGHLTLETVKKIGLAIGILANKLAMLSDIVDIG